MKRRCCILLLLPVLSVLGDGGAWTADNAMLMYFDAATKVRRQALEPRELPEIVAGSLTAYLKTLDPYSRYLSVEAYARWQQIQSSDYAGVGMELSVDREGRILCLPYPGSPAAEAGIRDGDCLVAVNSAANPAMDLMSVGMMVRGSPGTDVSLRIRSADGSERDVDIYRRAVRAPSVVAEEGGVGLHRVRIFRFTESTAAELAAAADTAPPSVPLVLDLRGNPGGSLYDAMDAARLFLPRGAVVAAVRTREGTREHRSLKPPPFPDRSVWLLQDERSASSAEVFIAALTQNRRARSIGARTVGKGTTQSMIELVDGSAMLLTVGQLLGPDGRPFHQVGLEPQVPLDFSAGALDQQLIQAIGALP